MEHLEKHYTEISKFFKHENLISLSDNSHNFNRLNTMEILHLQKVDPNFKKFNKHRKEVVHYYQFETTYKHQILENNSNKEEIKKLWNWKNNMPSYFKNHLNLSCEGFVKTYELIKNMH